MAGHTIQVEAYEVVERHCLKITDETGDEGKGCRKHVSRGDTVQWCSNSATTLTVTFPYGNPFQSYPNGPNPAWNSTTSCTNALTIDQNAPFHRFKYNVILSNNSQTTEEDPQVIIDHGKGIFKIVLGVLGVLGLLGFLTAKRLKHEQS